MIIGVIQGDLLESGEMYIAQQCNCVTLKAHGLSQSIKDKYPWADVYGSRPRKSANTTSAPSTPGTILTTTDGTTTIIHMFAQWTPGKPGQYMPYYPGTYADTKENRREWFARCIRALDGLGLDRVAMPYGIGCGLAGGKWPEYEAILNAARTKIVLYQLP